MREFFKGWRRKAGCGVLLIACFLGIAWARSKINSEVVVIGFTNTVLLSHEGRILLWQSSWASDLPFWSQGASRQGPRYIDNDQGEYYNVPTGLKTGQIGIVGYTFAIADAWVAPHWLIVLLLTLLSAYLILWKPRQKESRDA